MVTKFGTVLARPKLRMIIIIVRVFENDNQYHNGLGQKMTGKDFVPTGQKVSIEKVYLPMGATFIQGARNAVFRAWCVWSSVHPQSPRV